MRAILHIDNSSKRRQVVLRSGQSITVGRTEAADIAIPDDSLMSRIHVRVTYTGDRCVITDLKSTNGVVVGGQKITETSLSDGGEFLAGQTQFRLELEREAAVDVSAATAISASANMTSVATSAPSLRLTANEAAPPVLNSESTGKQPATSHPTKASVNLVPSRRSEDRSTLIVDSKSDVSEAEDEIFPIMQLENQTKFSVGLHPWENRRGEFRLTVCMKATYQLSSDGSLAVAAKQLPIAVADVDYEGTPTPLVKFESDTTPFKPRADIVLVGQAHAPGKRAVEQLDVRLRVGRTEKTIRVFGDRKWWFPNRLTLVPVMSKPVPFVTMPLRYDLAFGGIDEASAMYCAENLAGTGYVGRPSPDAMHEKKLPNLEDPNNLIIDGLSKPRPVGFGFYGRGWQPRLRYIGTFDEKYQRERAPLMPLDFSYEYHNGAHPDLQSNRFLNGDEEVELDNLTPDSHRSFRLPGLRPRMTVHRILKAARKPAVKSTQTAVPNLDTVVIVPDGGYLYLLYRAVFELSSLEEPDISRIVVQTA